MSEVLDLALGKALSSESPETAKKAVAQFSEKGSPASLPFLIDLLKRTQDESLVNDITTLLNEMKDQACVPVLIKYIDDDAYKSVRKVLVSACWQNGLKYGAHLASFLRVFQYERFDTAFDAFTLIEEQAEDFPLAHRKAAVDLLKDGLSDMSSEKKALTSELVHMLGE